MRKQWNSTLSFYWYDQHGRRVAKSEADLLTLYIWDGMDIIATAHADGTIREYYTRGIGIAGDVGSLVAETRFENNAAVSTTYLHSNWRGDVVMATDTSGAVVGEYSYTTFGEQLSATGTYTPRFTFSSKERDASGLVYHGFRYYSPVLCRWISEDPIGEAGGINLYQFCWNDPVNGIDPYGEDVADYNWDWLYNTSDALAGFGDTISWGLTSWLREQMGYNDSTDPCSSSYRGGEIAGIAYDVAWGLRGAAGLGKNALKNSKHFGKGSKMFGRSRYMPKGVKSTFNNGDGIRTGWGWKESIKNDVFRTSWSKPGNRTYWNHIDWF